MLLRTSSSTSILVTVVLCISAFVSSALSVALPNSADWINSNLVKQIELTGSSSHQTTTLNIKPSSSLFNPSSNNNGDAATKQIPYYFLLSSNEASTLSWARVTLKPASDSALAQAPDFQPALRSVLQLRHLGTIDNDPTNTHIYVVEISTDLIGKDGVSLTFESTLNHATTPLPKQVKQNDPTLLLWTGDSIVKSPYKTTSARIKVKAPTPKILSYSPESEATKSGSVVTFGPLENVPPYTPSSSSSSSSSKIEQARVHYQSETPQASIITYDRVAEISHWGDALSLEDRILLRNTGPELQGHFSRIQHQMSTFYQKSSSSALSTINIYLPAGARDPYFIDQIGNVSTSRFRPSLPDPTTLLMTQGQVNPNKLSLLELQPRFPLLGGWNYSFSLGFNLPLSSGGWAKSLSNAHNEYLVAIPLFTPIKDVAVDNLTTRIVLPEGARNVQLELPFPMDETHQSISKTYLDTIGRPTITLRKVKVSANHARLVYVRYSLPTMAHLQKVWAVGGVTALLFAGAAVLQRVDTKIR